MFRLCFSLLTKCCVGCDGGIDNDDDKGGDCGAVDDDICTICQDISLKVKQSSEDRGSSTVNGVFLSICFEGRRQY